MGEGDLWHLPSHVFLLLEDEVAQLDDLGLSSRLYCLFLGKSPDLSGSQSDFLRSGAVFVMFLVAVINT